MKKFDICVIGGCGHVGLPLALCFAQEGKRVAIVDVNESAVRKIRSGKMPFKDEGGDEILPRVLRSKKLTVDTDPRLISESENIIFVLGTPVSTHLYPSYTQFYETLQRYMKYFKKEQLIVFRSTLFPGSMKTIRQMFADAGLRVSLAFCPERVAEGLAIREIYELPQIVSAFDAKSRRRAKALFSVFTKELVELEPLEAELGKLFTNVWRYMKFAIANQFYMIANDSRLDFYKIYNAIVGGYPRLKDMPRAGFAAGPCLFKDTMQLASFTDNRLFLGHAAMLINEGLPSYLITQLRKRFSLEKKRVGILGMAFKAESDDSRESLSFKLLNILQKDCRAVYVTDPFVKDPRILPVQEVVKKSDILIIGAPHREYKKLNLSKKTVIDVWNLYGKGGLV